MVKQSYYLIFIFLSIAADMNIDSPCLSKVCEGLPHVPRSFCDPPKTSARPAEAFVTPRKRAALPAEAFATPRKRAAHPAEAFATPRKRAAHSAEAFVTPQNLAALPAPAFAVPRKASKSDCSGHASRFFLKICKFVAASSFQKDQANQDCSIIQQKI